MRIGLVGAGRIGVLHAETLHEVPDVTELVIADVDQVRARAVADKLGSDSATIDDLFRPGRVDAVVIAAATSAHAELVHRSADARLPVFCEKPLAVDVKGTREVIDHVESAGVPLQVGFQRRFDAGYRAAREAVLSGRLGFVHSLFAATFDRVPPHAGYIPTSGGIYRDCHIHDFDIARFVTGREVVSVYATGGNKGAEFFRTAGDVDTSAATLTFDDGTVAVVLGGRYNGAGYDVRMEVHGSDGMIAVGLDDRAPLRTAERDLSWSPDTPYSDFFDRFRAAYVTELGDFVAHAQGRIPNPCPPADALEALYVAEAAELSRQQNRPVQLEEVR